MSHERKHLAGVEKQSHSGMRVRTPLYQNSSERETIYQKLKTIQTFKTKTAKPL